MQLTKKEYRTELKRLWQFATTGSLESYEKYIKTFWNNWIPPHLSDFLDQSNSLEQFLNLVDQFENY